MQVHIMSSKAMLQAMFVFRLVINQLVMTLRSLTLTFRPYGYVFELSKPSPTFRHSPSSDLTVSPGDSIYRRGLSAACADGLPRGPAPTDAALLAEGEKSSAQIHRCCFVLG